MDLHELAKQLRCQLQIADDRGLDRNAPFDVAKLSRQVAVFLKPCPLRKPSALRGAERAGFAVTCVYGVTKEILQIGESVLEFLKRIRIKRFRAI